jgi:hypothetical protein
VPVDKLAQFPLRDGGFLIVEVDALESASEKVMRGSAPAEAFAKATDTFESALEKVRSAAVGILQQLRSLEQAPDEIAVEFGVKLNVESGAIIAKVASEANFKINLTWKKSTEGK